MTQHWAKAYPRKAFFIEMFTRDISLEDCILDLIDNSIDSLIRSRNLETTDILFSHSTNGRRRPKHRVQVTFDETKFEIRDNCGGISAKSAEEDVFNFGHSTGYDAFSTGRRLGAYGIGLKRALFKMGRHFKINSRTMNDGFNMDVDISAWIKRDEELSDWRFPIEYSRRASSLTKAGTEIVVTELPREVRSVFSDPTLHKRLHQQIAQTYCEFLKSFVTVEINGETVDSRPIPLGRSSATKPSVEDFLIGEVGGKVIANFAAKGPKGSWKTETAG